MVVGDSNINNIMSGIENTGGVKQHNHKKKLKQRFDIIKKLGQGTFGKVQLGINKETGQEVAIKTIKKSKIESEADLIRIRREIQIMSSVHHPNIIHIYEVFENREKMVLVMEYAAGGELYDYLSERKVLPEEEARRIFRQIATACYYCHKHKICHRDLKLENILLDENNNAKIADFGLSNVFDDQRVLSTFCGSPLYASPEIVKGTPYHGPEVDCWSLGVLLYTLVYGAMPFDGSNFKRLVKQISQGDYFEPAQPSPASPLIRDMLTVNPKYRANIEKICSHWWVNENYDEDCLVISEELANQTPVRLDLLLSLAPPPPQLESDKLLVTDDVAEEVKTEVAQPTRSQSVGSLMELSHPAERRIKELLNDEKISPKRKLETTISTDRANLDKGLKRKDKIIKENTVADITVHGVIKENDNSNSSLPLDKSLTQTISRSDMDIEQHNDEIICDDPSLQGAVCSEILEEANKKIEPKKTNKTKRTLSSKVLEGINEIPSQENVPINNNNNNNIVDKENIGDIAQSDVDEQKPDNKSTTKRKTITNKKKVLADKNDNNEKSKLPPPTLEEKKPIKEEIEDNKVPKQPQLQKEDSKHEDTSPPKQIERRRSRIFEAAEKFQNMISPTETKPVPVEKPKKIIIPGVSVDGFKKEFERKASLTSTSPPKTKGPITKKTLIDKPQKSEEKEAQIETSTPSQKPQQSQSVPQQLEQKVVETKKDTPIETPKTVMSDEERKERVRNAVSIISSALDKEGARKSKSRPCCVRKPPVPFGASGRSASVNIGLLTSSPLSPPVGPKPFVRPQFDKPAEAKQVEDKPEPPIEENKTSSAEITLKSATLPRRKTTKAEIQLNYPTPKPATMEFKTEMAHPVAAPPPSRVQTQRSEVVVPVAGHPVLNFRSTSLEPDQLARNSPKEHIIPISFEKTETATTGVNRDNVQSPPAKPPMPRPFQQQPQKTYQSQRSGSISRQSTQESDSETTSVTGEPIKKSPREYIIPIAVEGGGYVTPRAGSLEPSETSSTTSTIKRRNNIGRAKRMGSLLSDRDSEDDSQYGSLYRHSSFGKDSDTEDSRKDNFHHMHRLRSTRPKRTLLEHNDSLSSGEEDDDDGFEILTAEHLFSNLLSRVRDLTQKLNVEDGGRPGFPSSRLLTHFDRGTNFWNFHNRLSPLSRHTMLGRSFSRDRDTTDNSVPWRRSVSRDLASDIDSVFNEQKSTTPRGDKKSKKENLNLADLDFKNIKLSDEDALALSYLTPGLSRRIQKQLFSQLPPSELKKLQRTLSASCNNNQENDDIRNNAKFMRRSVDRISSVTSPTTTTTTLPRKYPETDTSYKTPSFKSNLPIKSRNDYNTKIDFDLNYQQRPKTNRSLSLREPKIKSPESSLSDSLSRNDDNNSDSYSSISRPYSKYLTKTDTKKPTITSPRRISRFLRPDFFDPPKDDNIVVKEKKERELETQKVLKEIRDKRKSRLRRERSSSREKTEERTADTNLLLNNISNNIKNLENSVKNVPDYVNVATNHENNNEETKIHDYVNVKSATTTTPPVTAAIENGNNSGGVVKKGKISRLVRPKSYPIDNLIEKEKLVKLSPEKELTKETKISKLRRGFTRHSSKERKDDDNNKTTVEDDKGGHKNKLLQSIEKKLEKFRSSNKDDESKLKKSAVENTIRKLREQSLPRNLEHCTESGLIKRAVSVEDLPNINANISNNNTNKPLQASRKSVTKILGLFKKYEEQENKKNEKVVKKKKVKESNNGNKNEVEDKKNNNEESKKIVERPRSLLLDRMKNATKSDTVVGDKETKQKTSKLPVNSYRRSLNLDNIISEPTQKLDRKNLKLDLKKIPTIATDNNDNGNNSKCLEVTPSTSSGGANNQSKENRNSSTTDDSMFLSPDENLSCDSWSVCSDYHHTNDLLQSPISTTTLSSPQSPIVNGYVCSGDENESVIDRIRRKSFYTRFNEKKRVRRPSLTRNYKDLDLYRELSTYKSPDYGSLDRHTYDYRPITRRSSLLSPTTTPVEDQQSNRAYTRSSSLMNDYVNLPNRYQTYNSRIGRSIYSDSDDNHLDDLLTAAKSKKYSSQFQQPSRLCNRISPTPDNFNNDNNNNNGNSTIRNRRASSVLSNSTSPASPGPV